MKPIYIITLLTGLALLSNAQHAPAWVKFSEPSNYANFDGTEVAVGTDGSGNVYTAASMIDTISSIGKALIVKYDGNGNKLWQNSFYDSTDVFNQDADVVALLVDNAGNSYVCGYGAHNNTNAKDFMVIKYNTAGVYQWVQFWDGTAGTGYNDIVTSACFSASGNIVLAGYSKTGNEDDDIAIVEFDTNGNLQWSYTYNYPGGNDEDRAYAVASDLNNNIFVTGSSYDPDSRRDVITIKVNSSGVNVWTKRLTYTNDTYQDHGYAITTDSLGNAYVTGSASQAAGSCVAIKYDANGNEVWNNPYPGPDADAHGSQIMLDKFGNVILVGYEFISTANQNDYMVVKYTNAGALVWGSNFNFGYESIETPYSAAVDTNGRIYVTGTYSGNNADDMQTIVVSPFGQLLWNTSYSNQLDTLGTDRAYAMVLDKSFNIIIAGIAQTSEQSADGINVVTLKYAAPNLTTGIAEVNMKSADMNIYPNPAKNDLTVAVTDENLLGAQITVFNLLGEAVLDTKLTELTQHINLANYAKGMYVVNIKNETSAASRKLIIE